MSTTREFFQQAYRTDSAPWDIGHPQPEIEPLIRKGFIKGSVLDIGCGTGSNTIFLAERGLDAWGVDNIPEAIDLAREKAEEARKRYLDSRLPDSPDHAMAPALPRDRFHSFRINFILGDVLSLNVQFPTRMFDTVLDIGLFHTLEDRDRPTFLASVDSVLAPGGNYVMLCFSEHEPGDYGPRRISRREILDTFHDWTIREIRPAKFHHKLENGLAEAWLAIIGKSMTRSRFQPKLNRDTPSIM
jgi:SAM-dependent methyltransferase